MNTKFLVGAGAAALLLWSLAKPAVPAYQVGQAVTYEAGTIVAPPAELYAQMDPATKMGYAVGAANADLALTDTLACEDAAKMGLRGAMESSDPVTKLYYALRDTAVGTIDC
jgi:hypothetical protein